MENENTNKYFFLSDDELKEITNEVVRELEKEETPDDLHRKVKTKSWKYLLSKLETYYRHCRNENKPLSMEGYAARVGRTTRTLQNWANSESHHGAIVRLLRALIGEMTIVNGLTGQFHSGVVKMVMQHLDPGYSDKQDVKTENSVSVTYFEMPLPEED